MTKISKILNLSVINIVINIVIKYKLTYYCLLLMMLTCHKIMFVLRHVSVRLVSFRKFRYYVSKKIVCFKYVQYADIVKPSNEF